MNLARDWYRISARIWVVYTTSDAEKWYGRLHKVVKDAGRMFICKLDISDRQGWMDEDFWDWARKYENSAQGPF